MMDERRQKSVSTERSAFVLKFALFFCFFAKSDEFRFFQTVKRLLQVFFLHFTLHFILKSLLLLLLLEITRPTR